MLLLPSANRVYASASPDLARAELAVFSESVLGGALSEAVVTHRGGVPYLEFAAERLPDEATTFLSQLSAIYALFEISGSLLKPTELNRLDRYDDDLITIQKYQGKTNEQFTKLLLNVTLMSSAFAPELASRRLAVLDPLCGRGTTLNQALMYGWDAAGIDHDVKDFEAYSAFIQTWLKHKRIKHHAQAIPVRRERRVLARRLKIELAAEKSAYKAGRTQHLDVVHADTVSAPDFFRPEAYDVIVADAPYGVQHGSSTAGRSLARSPLELLRAATPGWSLCSGRVARSGCRGTHWSPAARRQPRSCASRSLR